MHSGWGKGGRLYIYTTYNSSALEEWIVAKGKVLESADVICLQGAGDHKVAQTEHVTRMGH